MAIVEITASYENIVWILKEEVVKLRGQLKAEAAKKQQWRSHAFHLQKIIDEQTPVDNPKTSRQVWRWHRWTCKQWLTYFTSAFSKYGMQGEWQAAQASVPPPGHDLAIFFETWYNRLQELHKMKHSEQQQPAQEAINIDSSPPPGLPQLVPLASPLAVDSQNEERSVGIAEQPLPDDGPSSQFMTCTKQQLFDKILQRLPQHTFDVIEDVLLETVGIEGEDGETEIPEVVRLSTERYQHILMTLQ